MELDDGDITRSCGKATVGDKQPRATYHVLDQQVIVRRGEHGLFSRSTQSADQCHVQVAIGWLKRCKIAGHVTKEFRCPIVVLSPKSVHARFEILTKEHGQLVTDARSDFASFAKLIEKCSAKQVQVGMASKVRCQS